MGRPPKKRGPGRPRKDGSPAQSRKKSKAKKKDTKKKKSKPKKASKPRPRALAKKPAGPVNLVAGKFVIATTAGLLVKRTPPLPGIAGEGPVQFSSDHSLSVETFEVFGSRPEAQAALVLLKDSYGLLPKPAAPAAAEKDGVDLGFLDGPAASEAPKASDDMGFDTVPGETVAEAAPPASEPPMPEIPLPAIPSLDPSVADALARAEVAPLGQFFATNYHVAGDNTLEKTIVWKEQATTLSAAVRVVRHELTEQLKVHTGALKEFDRKVAVARKDHLADVNEATRLLDKFDRQARNYA